ncbi:MAG: polysaccharide deacetylase family protein [Chthoniobacteraceae bacterium]
MTRNFVLLLLCTTLALTGCDKIKNPFGKKEEVTAPAAPTAPTAPSAATDPNAPAPPSAPEVASASPEVGAATDPAAPATAKKAAVDLSGEVVVLCYHRVEGKAGGALSIEPALFEEHMKTIKDEGLSVISMKDFLAWRRGEQSIPKKSVLITIDDGYQSAYDVAWPVLKKYNYPFTMFVYLDYIAKGGKSMTWDQLAEMRDAGVEIGSHTISHQDLRRKPSKAKGTYEEWLKEELEKSRQVIEERLGVRCATIAYPFGNHNPKVQEAARAAGYDAAFTTYGQRLGNNAPAMSLGRYDVTAKGPRGADGFTLATSFEGAIASGEQVMAQDAAASMVTQPMDKAVIRENTPTLKANVATMGDVDMSTVEMRISGVGKVQPKIDKENKTVTYQITERQKLRPGNVTVIIHATVGGRPAETRWSFVVDPNAPEPVAGADEPLPPRKPRQ